MITLVLLVGALSWALWSALAGRAAARQETQRLDDKIEQRRQLLVLHPDAASVHESLGDALREAGMDADAAAFYQSALDTEACLPGGASGGMGLEYKLRRARADAALNDAPACGQLATRQQVCRRCGALNEASERNCVSCREPLPVDNFLDTLTNPEIRGVIFREAAHTLVLITVVLIALAIASWMPLEIKGCLFLAATIVLAWRFLKAVGGG